MAADPPFYHDRQYQCWCGVNAERAAFVIGVLGIVWSCLSLSIVSLVAYACVVVAIRTRNPTYYKVFAFIAGIAMGLYIVAIALLVAWIAVVDTDSANRTIYVVALVLAIIELLLQFWICWIMRKAYAYTGAVRDFEHANRHTDQHHYPSAYPPHAAPQTPPMFTAETPYPRQAAYPQSQPAYPEKV
ncbi:hypothetical protein AAVH_23854 [Aphelenchoides avenae]|nr:hypothetical protein AAVH_23854 [Aphelenchus avenae]